MTENLISNVKKLKNKFPSGVKILAGDTELHDIQSNAIASVENGSSFYIAAPIC